MMNADQKINDRLKELISLGEKVLTTRRSRSGPGYVYMGDAAVDYEMAHQWGTSCLNILGRVFGKDSDHYNRFNALFYKFHDHSPIKKALGILRAAYDDYEKGYLFETRSLIEAEVFDNFLEQAEYLFGGGYIGPAAVIAGSVSEDGLRKLCQRKSIVLPAKPKLDSMNSELAKAGVYSTLVQKRITVLADVRNKAAHGKWSEFKKTDVEQMIAQVRTFMEDHFS